MRYNYAPDAGDLGVASAHKCPRPVENHAIAGLEGLLPLALLDGLSGLIGLILSCKILKDKRCR